MKLFWFSGESRLREWIFARTEGRASELYAEVLIMSGAPATQYWGREVTGEAVAEAHREHFDAAIAFNQEGFGEFDPGTGWTIISLAERIKKLSKWADGGLGFARDRR